MSPKKKSSRALIPTKARALSAKEFLDLADVPPEIEWFANITNPQTRRAYQNDLKDFMRFARISHPEVFRIVTRAHLIAWRKQLVRLSQNSRFSIFNGANRLRCF